MSLSLTDLQSKRVAKLNKEFSEEQDVLIKEFDSERSLMLDQHQREMTELTDIMFAMEQNFNEREGDAKSEFQSMRDEIKNKVSHSFQQLLSYFKQSSRCC